MAFMFQNDVIIGEKCIKNMPRKMLENLRTFKISSSFHHDNNRSWKGIVQDSVHFHIQPSYKRPQSNLKISVGCRETYVHYRVWELRCVVAGSIDMDGERRSVTKFKSRPSFRWEWFIERSNLARCMTSACRGSVWGCHTRNKDQLFLGFWD